jgi:hypothetical protein
MPRVPRPAILAATLAALAAAVPSLASAGGEERARASAIPAPRENPCLGELAPRLRCPDLRMRPPFDLYVDRTTRPGRTLLRAGNSIDSIGAGPAELRGERSSRYWMRAIQRIVTRRGGRYRVRTGARLFFKFIPGQTRYWKYADAARFELWRLDETGLRLRRVRTGPKVSYCLRDLKHTRPRLRRSPRRMVYPACNTSGRTRRVTLGTSIGWSDVYPSTYPEQWIDTSGLRGCFAFDHIADPRNGIWESNERNNRGTTVVRLPYRPGRQRCPRASFRPVPTPVPAPAPAPAPGGADGGGSYP